jgi:hypothetical protein
MVLTYRYRYNGGEWEPVEQVVLFNKTPCHFGGYRLWFLCPRCRRRVAILYGASKYFLCRHCYHLTYTSQQESPALRLMSKAQNIRERLGGSTDLTDLFPDKPKNMHWKTYQRLRRVSEMARKQSWTIIEKRFGVMS